MQQNANIGGFPFPINGGTGTDGANSAAVFEMIRSIGQFGNANSLLSVNVDEPRDLCGFSADCGCVPVASKVIPQYFVPPQAASLISVQELNDVCQRFSRCLQRTYIAPFPLIVIPFVFLCLMGYYASRRARELDDLVEAINQETYLRRNCHW
jgi:hypothetical protein